MAETMGGAGSAHLSSRLGPNAADPSHAIGESAPFDLDTFFIVQKGNLAVLHEAQALLADAVHAIARTQQSYLVQLRHDLSPLSALGGGISAARDVLGVAADAQARIGDLLSRGLRLNLDH
jgi:hypothetical protein